MDYVMDRAREMYHGHEPLQLLYLDDRTNKYSLNTNKIKKLIDDNDIHNYNLSIISVAGATRTGKSFLLSFFLRYLHKTYEKKRTDWMGDSNKPLRGFTWRGGSDRETTGIWVWSKAYKTINSKGEKIAVLLMDTQGTFDTDTTVFENVTIFALSTIASTVQIYNIMKNIQENDLQNLQLFTEYGKLAMDHKNGRAFQSLVFLVRDWDNWEENAYGFGGGKEILAKKLRTGNNRSVELENVRKHIHSCFENLECFLMPEPGKIARQSKAFNGSLSDIDPEFIQYIKKFVPEILHPDKLIIKNINGENLQAKRLLFYFEPYFKMFESGEIPPAKTILEATTEATCSIAVNVALEYYYNEMNKLTAKDKPAIEFNEMMNFHDDFCKVSIEIFERKAVFDNVIYLEKYLTKLNLDLQNQLRLFLFTNETKRTSNIEESMENLTKELEKYSSSNEKQTETIQALKKQFEQYQESSEAEKKILRGKLQDLQYDLDREINMTSLDRLANFTSSSFKKLGGSLSDVYDTVAGWFR